MHLYICILLITFLFFLCPLTFFTYRPLTHGHGHERGRLSILGVTSSYTKSHMIGNNE